ncbi:MAG TPA: hypothetical protein VJV78_00495, partial [Polyangiales bacterium]|nr:hypothetical protein [Polyangiales bacterium]
RIAAPAGEGGSGPVAGDMARTPGTSSPGRIAPSADPSCAEFVRKSSGVGFAAGSCGNLSSWTAPRATREGFRAAEVSPLVIRGGDGLAGLAAFLPNASDAEPQLEVFAFDGAGTCRRRIGQVAGEVADARYELLAALERAGSRALQIGCIAARPCSSQLLWNERVLETRLSTEGVLSVQRIAITQSGQLVLASFIMKPATPMPDLGLLVPAETSLDLRLFDAAGALVRQTALPAPGRLIAIAIAGDDQLFVLSDELTSDPSADAGAPSRPGSRIDRYDLTLSARASWRAPVSVQLRALDVSASGQLAIVGSIDEPVRGWVHVLNAANFSDYWPAPVIGMQGGAFAVQVPADGEVLAFGSATPAEVWLMRYTRGQCVWPTGKIYRSEDQGPGRALELHSAVQAQRDGSILASGHGAFGYCD